MNTNFNSRFKFLRQQDSVFTFLQLRKNSIFLPPNVRSNLIDIIPVAAAKQRFQRAIVEHALLQQSINTNNSKKELPSFMHVVTLDPPSTGSSVPTDKGLESPMRSLGNAEVVLKLEKVSILHPIAAASDLLELLL